MRNLVIAGAAVVAAAALFVVLRPDDGDDDVPQAVTATAGTTTDLRETLPEVTLEPAPPAKAAEVRVNVRNGRPVGGVRRVTVGRNRRVILIVTADVSDHVHLHGYDVMRDVAPGRPARIEFRATIVGTVEAELEDRRVRVASITVRP